MVWTPPSSTTLGTLSGGCLSRVITFGSTTKRRKSPLTPSHSAQVLDHPDYGLLWWESTAETTDIPCVFCGEIAGVHARRYRDRRNEIAWNGGTIIGYPWIRPPSEAQHVLLASWWMSHHGLPYGYWDAYRARRRGFGRVLSSGWYRGLPDRWKPFKDDPNAYFCNEAVGTACKHAEIWDGIPSEHNPATMVADWIERGLIPGPRVIWTPDMRRLNGGQEVAA